MTTTIVTLPDTPYTSISSERRSKHWIKALATVDTSKADGFAFVGEFARHLATVELAQGTYLLGYYEDVAGTGRLRGRDVVLYQVQAGEVVTVREWSLDSAPGWTLRVRDEIAAIVNTPAVPDVDALLAEREQLLARLAEIDSMLPEPEGVEVDTRHAARALGISVRTMQRWAATGRVQAHKDEHGRWVITITINA